MKQTPFHDRDHAHDFDRRVGQSSSRSALIEEMISLLGLHGSERGLDMGVGTGRVARAILPHLPGGWLAGVDPAAAMLEVAGEQKIGGEWRNLLLVCGEAERLPLRAGSFDFVVSVFSFHHFSHKGAALQEACRSLRRGGRVMILDPVVREPTDAAGEEAANLVQRAFRRTHGPAFCLQSLAELRQILALAGFSEIAAQSRTLTFQDEPVEKVPMGKHWYEAAQAAASHKSEAVRSRFADSYFLLPAEKEEEPRLTGSLTFAFVSGCRWT